LLELKALNWKEWAFTNGSCMTIKIKWISVYWSWNYHAQSNKIITANPRGTSINKIINRSELAGIAAALINEHTHIVTDSASALWQIENSILYPQHMKWHKHARLLETIVHHIQLSKDTIHLYKV
jgi:hypothetical protein